MNALLDRIVKTPLVRNAARVANRLTRLKNPVAVRVGGHTLYAQTLDRLLALYLLKSGANESFETALFEEVVKNGMRVMDVGANLGYYTLLAARKVGSEGRVYALEPDPENFELLQRALRTNGYTNIETFQTAASNISGAGTLFFCPENRGDHRIYDSADGRKGISIETMRLDDVLEKSVRIDVIKMDIQGAEGKAIEGMERIFAENPDLIVMTEFWPHGLEQSGVSPVSFLERIENLGFHVRLINESKAALEDVAGEDLLGRFPGKAYGNLFLTRGPAPRVIRS